MKRHLFAITKHGWAVFGVASGVIGIAGVPGDVSTWEQWIAAVVNDPRVSALAKAAVSVADFINQGWFRVSLVAFGLLVVIWPLRWFWRLRHRITFRWRRMVSEQVWITREQAKDVVKKSPWGRLKEPNVVQTVSIFDNLTTTFGHQRVIHGLSDTQKVILKFSAYVDATIDSFCEANPSATRTKSDEQQIDEVALREFLRVAMEGELKDEFGSVPAFKVT